MLFANMKITFTLAILIICVYFQGTNGWWGGTGSRISRGYRWTKGYLKGTKDMAKTYGEMRAANVKHSDKYYHSKANFLAARHGDGGRDAARHISDLREWTDKVKYGTKRKLGLISEKRYRELLDDSEKDQEANRWGRDGNDYNKYKVDGIPETYKNGYYYNE